MKDGEHICVNCGLRCQSLHRCKAINEYVSILSELLSLVEKIPELEKTARRTPPRHMVKEKEKVEAAKKLLIQMKERKVKLEGERDKLFALFEGKPYPVTGKEYIT